MKRQVQEFLLEDRLIAPEGSDRTWKDAGDKDLILRRVMSAKFSDADVKGTVRKNTQITQCSEFRFS